MKVLRAALVLLTSLSLFVPMATVLARDWDMKVTLLGTGTPQLNPRRMSYSTLVEAGDQLFMFDAGRAAMLQAKKSGANLKKLDKLFLTHFHSDHVVGIPDVWLTGFLAPFFRAKPLKVWGPKGVDDLTDGLEDAYEFDVTTRVAQYGGNRGAGMEFEPTEVFDGYVYESGGVKITAFAVDHKEANPAFGYRIDYKGRSVVLSGDTVFNENVIKHAKGADLLVHQIGYAPKEAIQKNKVVRKIIEHHTQPHQVAQVLARSKPKMAVLSHIVVFKMKGPDLSPQGEEAMMDVLRADYEGPVLLGQDLMAFEIGDKVKVLNP